MSDGINDCSGDEYRYKSDKKQPVPSGKQDEREREIRLPDNTHDKCLEAYDRAVLDGQNAERRLINELQETRLLLNAERKRVQELEAGLRKLTSEEFLRKWYEQMKADDPHHFAEHEEYDGSEFPTTYGEYKFDEHFRQCGFIESFLKVAESLLTPEGQ